VKFEIFRMSYEIIESQATFKEPHVLLVQENGTIVLVNLLIHDQNFLVYGEQQKNFIKTLRLDDLNKSALDLDNITNTRDFIPFVFRRKTPPKNETF